MAQRLYVSGVSRVSRLQRARFLRVGIAAAVLALAGAGGALAAPAPFATVTTPVLLDGRPVSRGIALNETLNTIVYDGGQYHLWYVHSSYKLSGGVGHATSSDGIHFTSGAMLTVPVNWWVNSGATVEPQVNYLRMSRDGSGNWILMAWHPNNQAPDSYGSFNYNTSLWLLGNSTGNAALSLIGPLPSPPGSNHVGPFGIVGSQVYLGQDTVGAFGRYTLTPTTTSAPPTTSPAGQADAANVYTGTGFCSFATCPADPNASYIHNYGRTLDQGGSVLGTYYSLREFSTGARRGQQLWYIESTDGGTGWSAPQALFANGAAVTVDGLPNTFAFSLPEVAALGGGQYRSYFNTADACGNNVTVTAAPAGSQQGPALAKAFSPSTIAPGGVSQLTVTLSAPAATCTPAPTAAIYTSLGFTDTLPSGVALAATPAASTTCTGATVSAVGGAGAFSLSGASLVAGGSCTVTVDVTAAGAGVFRNTIPAAGLTNAQGVAALADASAELRSGLPADAAPVPSLGAWGAVLLALLLGGLGVRQLRRR